MRTLSPCLDCPSMHLGCHGACAKFTAYRKAHDAESAIINAAKARERIQIDLYYQRETRIEARRNLCLTRY